MTDSRMYENMLFDYGTTNRSDYRHGQLSEPVITSMKPKPPKAKTAARPTKGVHTLCDWRDERSPPFNLFHKPKPIIRTNPTHLQEPYVKPIDPNLEEVIRTRPRVTLVPASCLDDVEDPTTRAIICADMYTTEMKRVMQEAAAASAAPSSVRAPLPPLTTAFNPLTVRKLQPPVVPSEWKMESVSWDGKQLRAYYDRASHFWLRREPLRCQSSDETATVAAHRKMQRQMTSKASY